MKRILATLGLAGVAIFGLGGAAQAAYPPGDIGTLTVTPTRCEYTDPPDSELAHWEFTIEYNITAPDAVLKVFSDSGVDNLSRALPMGEGSLTIGIDSAGFESWDPYTGHIIMLQAGGDEIPEYASQCDLPGSPRPDDPDPDPQPWLKAWPKSCDYTEDGQLFYWEMVVDYIAVGDGSTFTIQSESGDDFYSEPVAAGQHDFAAGGTYDGFTDWNPFSAHTITLETGGVTLRGYVPPCEPTVIVDPDPDPDPGDPVRPGSFSNQQSTCPAEDDPADPGDWAFSFDYEVTEDDTVLAISNMDGDVELWSQPVAVGAGSLSIDNTTPGLENVTVESALIASLESPAAVSPALAFFSCTEPEVVFSRDDTTTDSSDNDSTQNGPVGDDGKVISLPSSGREKASPSKNASGQDASLAGVWVGKAAASNAAQSSQSISALPATGADGAGLALVALALLAGGAAMVWVSRRGASASV